MSRKVNRAFSDLIRASPLIQYQIDLFGAGLQRNPRTEASLADCRATFEAYCRRWETLDSAEKWDKVANVFGIREALAVNGTYGILLRDFVRFLTLGSVSLVFQEESGVFHSSRLRLVLSRSTLKPTSWPSSKRWRGRELCLRLQKRAELYRSRIDVYFI